MRLERKSELTPRYGSMSQLCCTVAETLARETIQLVTQQADDNYTSDPVCYHPSHGTLSIVKFVSLQISRIISTEY